MQHSRSLVDPVGRRWTVILPWVFTPAGHGSSLVFECDDGELRYGAIPIQDQGELSEELLRACLAGAVRVD
ncbi:MAG: hypothetical protein ACYC3Q_13665 [Gemmatimonadaceae bacterium]